MRLRLRRHKGVSQKVIFHIQQKESHRSGYPNTAPDFVQKLVQETH